MIVAKAASFVVSWKWNRNSSPENERGNISWTEKSNFYCFWQDFSYRKMEPCSVLIIVLVRSLFASWVEDTLSRELNWMPETLYLNHANRHHGKFTRISYRAILIYTYVVLLLNFIDYSYIFIMCLNHRSQHNLVTITIPNNYAFMKVFNKQ